MNLSDLFIHLARTIIYYGCLILLVRFLGKREIGKLGVFDLVILLMIANIACVSIENIDIPFWYFIIIITIIAIIQKSVSLLQLKFSPLRKKLDGGPSVMVFNGKINHAEMKKNLYNMDDLLMQIRGQGIESLSDIRVAILEHNGELSIFPYKETKMIPLPAITSGKINHENLYYLNLSENRIKELLGKTDIKDVICAFYDGKELFIVQGYEYLFKEKKRDKKNKSKR